MIFDGEKFSNLLKEKNITTMEIINTLRDKYNIELTIDAIKSYRRKGGKNAIPSLDKLVAFAEILGTSIDALSGRTVESPAKLVPVIGTASCGSCDINHLQDSSKKAYYNGDFWKKSLYCVIANGDSMSPEIDDGDEVIIDPDVKPITGDMVHYKIDDESAIKVLVIDEDAYIIQFVPYNSSDNFKTRTIRMDDEESMSKLTFHKVVSVNKLKFNNRAARLKMIGR
jgi:SOS-response transcriptional repressor LexA